MLTGYIRGQELRISTPEIAADSIKYLEAEFHFAGRDWDGYVKTAYFINGTSKFALALADDRITADMGLNLTAGEWEVKLSGVKGGSRITTTTEHVYVREFGSTDGTLPDVTATQAEQILAKIGDLSDLTTEDKTNLVAAINEAAKSGGGSGGGKDGTGIASITYKGEDASGGNMYTVLLTDGTSYDITAPKGAAGADGVTPHIGDNGNWYLGTTDTGKPSRGDKGEDAAADLTLGLTGATPGQIARITAVDASGAPTAWSPVDMPTGGAGETWEKIAEIELRSDTAEYVLADFATWRKAKVIMTRPQYISGLSKNVWCKVVGLDGTDTYSCGYLMGAYGYRFWEFSAEVNNLFIESQAIENNNTAATVNITSTGTFTPLKSPIEKYKFELIFVDTSVIQAGDKVTVIGVKR